MKASSRSDIPPFYVMEVMKAAAARDRVEGDVIHLEVGQPATPAPTPVLRAARRALESDRLGYTHGLGTDELRARIADHYRTRHGVEVGPNRVAVTVGASGGFALALLAAFDVGDRIGITEPGYAAYRNMIEALGLHPVGIRVGPETRYVPSVEALESAGPLDGMVVASPSNPTGTALTHDELEALVIHCESSGIRLISDEIYHGITYGGVAPTAVGIAEHVVVVQSFSKYYSMTGWRLGWNILPPELVEPTERLAQNLFISPPSLSQHAGLAAFDSTAELDANVARYAESRRMLVEAMARWRIPHAPPDGAFYLWVDVSELCDDSQELAARWLDELGVAVTPGLDFDPTLGHRFVRFSYSESPDDIRIAIHRLDTWFADGNR